MRYMESQAYVGVAPEMVERIMRILEIIQVVDTVDELFDYEFNNKGLTTFRSLEELAYELDMENMTMDDVNQSNFYFERNTSTYVFNFRKILRRVKKAS